ncbi:type II secretion system protein [Patescibacteria group bacterium]|nr:type II secretion system protein [Patescibacteria group bacterium]
MKKGFTFIELLVMISIVLLVTGGSIAYYSTFNQHVKLKAEAKKFSDLISLAYKKAESSELIPTSGTPYTYCNDFKGYQVDLNEDKYSLEYLCGNAVTTLYSYQLPDSIRYIGSDYSFVFPPTARNIDITQDTVTLKNSLINQCIDITITSNGITQVVEQLSPC